MVPQEKERPRNDGFHKKPQIEMDTRTKRKNEIKKEYQNEYENKNENGKEGSVSNDDSNDVSRTDGLENEVVRGKVDSPNNGFLENSR